MKLLVCISRTPETTAKIGFSADNKTFDTAGVSYIMNPYDEWYALVRAIELKEKHGGTVTVIHVGTAESDTVIRKALAIGADDAVRVDAVAMDARFTADQIAGYARDKEFDGIFLGKETIDYNGSEVGAMVAELLDLPFVSYASSMEMDGSTATIKRDIEGGVEVVRVQGAFVLSASKGLAEQRIPNMRGIMMAKRKPLEILPAFPSAALTVVEGFQLPSSKTEVTMVDPEDMDELIRLLHEEAKVI
jgi:electron transfer flavoprotein beta subunit